MLMMSTGGKEAKELKARFKFSNLGIWVEKDVFFHNFAPISL